MDLIYADANLIDQGVLQDYSFDMCYGDEDNTFEVKIQKYNPALQYISANSILYIEFTEYGGIVDRIESDTKTGEVTLKGRTWHGVMNGKVIEPPPHKAYRGYGGEANAVLAQMIVDAGLTSLFEASPENSGINIPYFEIRYEPMYDAILRIFGDKKVMAKLYCRFYGKKVTIGAVGAANYAQSEEFDRSQVPYKTGRTFNNVNHMVCLGQGEGEKRAVIHLFADEDGHIQPYLINANPKQDSDYLLNKSQQKVFGKDEIAYIYDFPSAEITTSYLPLSTEPANWTEVYVNYYKKKKNTTTGDIDYEKLTREKESTMELTTTDPLDEWSKGDGWKHFYYTDDAGQTYKNVTELSDEQAQIEYKPTGGYATKPWDWKDNYTDYWYPVGTPAPSELQQWSQLTEYKTETWVHLDTAPLDWNGNYSGYYTRAWDGVKWVYSGIQGVSNLVLEPEGGQTKKPTDWDTNWRNYYTVYHYTKRIYVGKGINNLDVYTTIEEDDVMPAEEAINRKLPGYSVKKGVLKWKKNKFYTKTTQQLTPLFPAGGVWNKVMVPAEAPFIENYYYKRYVNRMPAWKKADPNANPPFYGYWRKKENQEKIPTFVPNMYYYVVEDRYKVLLENAIKKFKELVDTSTLEIDLELEDTYDVGDVVGATDELTGEPINKPILRKIIKIKKDIVTVEYQVE